MSEVARSNNQANGIKLSKINEDDAQKYNRIKHLSTVIKPLFPTVQQLTQTPVIFPQGSNHFEVPHIPPPPIQAPSPPEYPRLQFRPPNVVEFLEVFHVSRLSVSSAYRHRSDNLEQIPSVTAPSGPNLDGSASRYAVFIAVNP